ncbi:MAG: acetyl-CoA carboxylase biotin carboxyl carrier protein subunit [Bacteroidales bacterium]|nr:acetyl-CoA carboxylase biotin carboxyl carrier protein subunit [Bacteroidales bacterium]MBN2756786.1 acetyl-CoA carboxylase biotin carboxyl carrier protein subunit [Bacteroidales bacterium]
MAFLKLLKPKNTCKKMITVEINEKEYKIDFDSNLNNKGIINDEKFEIDLIKNNENSYHIIMNNLSYNVDIVDLNKENETAIIKVNGQKYTGKVSTELDILLKKMGLDNLSSKKVQDLKAPMPGLVLDIFVKAGDEVKQGDNLVVLEAMKMENNLKSPIDGIIKEIKCEKSKAVDKNAVLVVFE